NSTPPSGPVVTNCAVAWTPANTRTMSSSCSSSSHSRRKLQRPARHQSCCRHAGCSGVWVHFEAGEVKEASALKLPRRVISEGCEERFLMDAPLKASSYLRLLERSTSL